MLDLAFRFLLRGFAPRLRLVARPAAALQLRGTRCADRKMPIFWRRLIARAGAGRTGTPRSLVVPSRGGAHSGTRPGPTAAVLVPALLRILGRAIRLTVRFAPAARCDWSEVPTIRRFRTSVVRRVSGPCAASHNPRDVSQIHAHLVVQNDPKITPKPKMIQNLWILVVKRIQNYPKKIQKIIQKSSKNTPKSLQKVQIIPKTLQNRSKTL